MTAPRTGLRNAWLLIALGAHARLRTTIALSVALGLASFVLVWLLCSRICR